MYKEIALSFAVGATAEVVRKCAHATMCPLGNWDAQFLARVGNTVAKSALKLKHSLNIGRAG